MRLSGSRGKSVGALILAAAAAAVGLLGGCGSGSGSPSSTGSATSSATATTSSGSPTVNVARAAYVTMQTPGFRFAVSIKISAGGQTATIGGQGAFDDGSRQGTLVLTLEGHRLLELLRYPYAYIRLPAGSNQLSGKPWLRFNAAQLTQTTGIGSSSGYDPTQTLDFLRGAGVVRRVGAERVRGVATTHYHAIVNVDRFASATPPAQRAAAERYAKLLKRITGGDTLPMDVYIDPDGRARRVTVRESICTAQGRVSEATTLDVYDFASQRVQPPPPASQVTDVSAKLLKAFKQGESQIGCAKSSSGSIG